MAAQAAGAQRGRFLSGGGELLDALRFGGGKQIPPPVQIESIAGFARPAVEQIDTAIHQTHHGVAGSGPPVAVALGRLVAGQRERRALIDEHDPPDAMLHGQVIRGRNAGDAGSADDDFGGGRAHRSRSPRRVEVDVGAVGKAAGAAEAAGDLGQSLVRHRMVGLRIEFRHRRRHIGPRQ